MRSLRGTAELHCRRRVAERQLKPIRSAGSVRVRSRNVAANRILVRAARHLRPPYLFQREVREWLRPS